MARKTSEGHDIGAREEALQKGDAAKAGRPYEKAALEQRIERLEKELEAEGPDGPRGVRQQPARPRPGTPRGRR